MTEASPSPTHHHHHILKNQSASTPPPPAHQITFIVIGIHQHLHQHVPQRHQHHHTLRLHTSRRGNRCLKYEQIYSTGLGKTLMLTMSTPLKQKFCGLCPQQQLTVAPRCMQPVCTSSTQERSRVTKPLAQWQEPHFHCSKHYMKHYIYDSN